ncbi:hypothetical protein RD792_008100 [Penstemon davidsonii]|uniref:Uncharacterized protein n=1 Tax=Penstemon davidsonii TaxID=160366 RepID=A0ABR0D8X8_9LAMI|nr:hypothetical protein RD792_008100 [Penstemon davidsonii]
MTSESGDSLQSISVRLNGKNFSYWSYVMKNFLKGKKMWGYVTGIEVKPTTDSGADYAKLLDIWETNNSKVITWINNSVECSIGMQLAKYECANDVWDHLTKLYTQSNFAKRYQLEHDIRALEQNDLGIQEFYTLMSNLWDQLALTEPTDLRGNSSFITYREEQRLVQFFMALRNDFEGIRGSILHRSPLPSVDSVVSELLAEETRLKSHSGKGLLPSPSASVLAVPSRPPANNRNQPYVPTAPDECRFCKKKGHWKSQCPVLMRQKPLQQQQPQHQSQPPWRYGNQQRPNMNSRPNTAAVVPSSDSASFGGSPSSSSSMDSLAEQIQQIQKILAIQPHAMSAASTPHIGLSPPGSSGKSPSTWLLDSGASHHMSPDSTVFTVLHSKPYGSVTTADGTPMPLAGIGPIDTPNMSLDSVYHIPNLAMNLVSVGQLCDSGYSVSFSSTSCHVQDQQSKKLIGTGRRQGGLYVLDKLKAPAIAASSVDLSSFHLNSSSSPFYLWHSRLGHVSAPRLKYLVSSGALGSLKTTDISDCSGYLIHIDPFSDNSENLSTDVPSTTDIDLSSSHSPAPVTSFPLHDHRRGQNVGTDNLDDSPPSTDAQPLPVIADPAHRYPHRTLPMATKVEVIMVPLPAQGHLNQLLHLSRLITAYNIPVHYVSTATHNHQAKLRVHGWHPLATANIHFHDFPIPEFPTPTINPDATNKFPSHLQPLFNSATHLRHPLTALVHSLSHTTQRVIVIHDSLMSSVVQDVGSIPNAESYVFGSISAFAIFWYHWERMENPFLIEEEQLEEIPSVEDCYTSEFMEFLVSEHKCNELSSGTLYNSSRVVEGKYMNLIQKMPENQNKKQWAIGPFNPVIIPNETKSEKSRHECLKWLDKQEPKSVIFVSFGTTVSLPHAQIKELATGLEQTQMKFIWVLRDADKGDLNTATNEAKRPQLPNGFELRLKERAIVVRDWAPQLEILGHFAIGGFLSHCGWNSCMESISMGVPIATWPMHSDQPRNSVLITKRLKIGVVVKDWEKRREIVTSLMVSEALKRLMASEEGEEMRRRAVELGGAVRRAVAEGGATRLEMDSFIHHICR